MKQFKVYLAGPIRGLQYNKSETWRDHTKNVLKVLAPNIHCYSPLRAKNFLDDGRIIDTSYPELGPLASARGIMSRDHFDCQTADAIFCNLMDTDLISVGTVMEIAWAFAYRKPLICCMEKDNLHEHPMIEEAINFRCSGINEGIDTLIKVLNP
jgi:nucleoside 2-deoxyribosyltransferase